MSSGNEPYVRGVATAARRYRCRHGVALVLVPGRSRSPEWKCVQHGRKPLSVKPNHQPESQGAALVDLAESISETHLAG